MPARIALALLAFLPPASLPAQEPKLPDAKAFDKLVVDTLRDIHNRGADLYNTRREFEGTYRMYQGALIAVRPLLAHRNEAQKMIDEGLRASEKESNLAQKAFRLHEAIEAVRAHLKGEPVKKTEEKLPEAKKPENGNSTLQAPAGKGGGPGFRGKVTLNGKPLAGGEVAFISLDKPKPAVFSARIQADGQYAPLDVVPPGKYVVIVTGAGVPERYHLTTTSGLMAEVQPPPSVFDINLQ